MKSFSVFISFKNTFNGIATVDSKLATQIYNKLNNYGIETFFSNITIQEMGESDFKEMIDEALDSAKLLLVIGSELDFITSGWVKYEWNSFHMDILSGDKTDSKIVTYLSEKIKRADKPKSLRDFESFTIEKNTTDEIVAFIINYFKSIGLNFEDASPSSYDFGIEKHSSYHSSATNEYDFLNIQAKLSRDIDMPVINYAMDEFTKGNTSDEVIYVLDLGCAKGAVIEDRFADYPYDNLYVVGIDRDPVSIEEARKANKATHIHYEKIEIESEDFEKNIKAYMKAHHIPGFNMVLATLFLRHLKNPEKTIEKVREIIVPGGVFIVREKDDGDIVSSGDKSLIKHITEKFSTIPGVSDYYYGRKVYRQLYNAGYKNIKTFHKTVDITDMDNTEKHLFFHVNFEQRINYLNYYISQNPEDILLYQTREWFYTALERLEKIFSGDGFWLMETELIFLAIKDKNSTAPQIEN